MAGEQFKSWLDMVKKNVKVLNDISVSHADDPTQNGIGGLVEGIYHLNEAAGSGDYNKIQPAALEALKRIGHINTLYLPPKVDYLIQNAATGLRELSKI